MNKKIEILFLTTDKFPPFRVDITVLFGKEIVGKGHHIDWILQSEKPSKNIEKAELYGGLAIVGPNFDNFTIFNRVKALLWGLLIDFKIFELMKLKRYDILLVKDKFLSGLLSIIAAKIFRVKFVYWLSFPFPEDSFFRVKEGIVRFPFLYWLRGIIFSIILYKIIFKYCDHAFVQTESMKSKIIEKGVPGKLMTAVPMAVSLKDIPFFGYNLKKNSKQNFYKVVYLGTLIKNRRMEFLLRSFAMVLEKMSNVSLYLVGGSEIKSDEDNLRSEAEKLGIKNAVKITGFIPQIEAWKYVKDADVCVSPIYPSPSFDVGSPTKLIEYMAMGKASVANDHPEQKIVISESQAGICVQYSESAFSDAILYLIKNPEISMQMGLKGREYIEKNRNYEITGSFVEKKLLSII